MKTKTTTNNLRKFQSAMLHYLYVMEEAPKWMKRISKKTLKKFEKFDVVKNSGIEIETLCDLKSLFLEKLYSFDKVEELKVWMDTQEFVKISIFMMDSLDIQTDKSKWKNEHDKCILDQYKLIKDNADLLKRDVDNHAISLNRSFLIYELIYFLKMSGEVDFDAIDLDMIRKAMLKYGLLKKEEVTKNGGMMQLIFDLMESLHRIDDLDEIIKIQDNFKKTLLNLEKIRNKKNEK